jgi:hypothetical protein
MIAYLEGDEEPEPIEEPDHPVHALRHGIMSFLLEHWRQLETQITCPAKSKDPRSCFGCIDTQVVTCLVQNPENEHRIEMHIPRRKK